MASYQDQGFIGQYLQSSLTESQQQTYYGDGWILADGRSAAGSVWASITGNTNVPDFRGRYIRGKDNAAGVDPNGDAALGTLRADQNKAHTHTGGAHTHGLNTRADDDAAGSDPCLILTTATGSTTTASGGAVTSGSSGGVDVQPLSGIANIFIKIN